ncbi:MAG: HNH endonuclease signature motif containing protein [Burkholderiaceae bacterium]|nr:HNH endonuclease signature motif containing protein [Burkholderiaceae bacterium]
MAEARERVKKFRLLIDDHIDPIEQRNAEQKAKTEERQNRKTFEECALACHDDKTTLWKNEKHKDQWINTLNKYAVPVTRIVDLLEAAHIIPHSEQSDYATSNGILLRADIHTLYDLLLLSVDEKYRVDLSKPVLNSDYRPLHGQTLKILPYRMIEQPSGNRLQNRHARFLEAESRRQLTAQAD